VILWSINLRNIITDKVRSDVMQIMLSFNVVSRVFVFLLFTGISSIMSSGSSLKKIKAARFDCLLNVISCISSSNFNDTCVDRGMVM